MSDSHSSLSKRPLLSKEIQDSFRRRRITQALAEECSERGYRATTITHVVARARVARNTIYSCFPNKEAIFLVLIGDAVAELDEQVARACGEAGEDPRQRVRSALAAVLEWIALNPAVAHALLVDAPSASPDAFALQLGAAAGFAERLREVLPADPARPAPVEELLIDGVASILRYVVLAGAAGRAPRLLDNLCRFLDQPYLDDSAASLPVED